jgi:hypothetical protein
MGQFRKKVADIEHTIRRRFHPTYSNLSFQKGREAWRAFTALRQQGHSNENEENCRLPVGTRRSRGSAGLLGEFPAKESQAR